MEIERLFELAVKDIGLQVKIREDKIEERRQEIEERQLELDRCAEMVKMKVRSEPQQRFVKNYLQMIKEGEAVLKRQVRRIDHEFESSVLDLRIKAPFFNYVIS